MSYFSRIKKVLLGSKEVKASSAYVICSVLQRCLSFITLPLFTRLLTTDEYGISTVYTSTMAVVIIFTTLNLPYGSFSPAMLKFEKDRDGYISSVNTISAPVSSAISRHFRTSSSFGMSSFGPHAQNRMPSFAQTTISEFATLFLASPKKVSFRPRISPNSSLAVRISASI